MVMQELPTPRPTFLLKRGDYDKPGEKVVPGVPAVLPPLPAGVSDNRLGLRTLAGPSVQSADRAAWRSTAGGR